MSRIRTVNTQELTHEQKKYLNNHERGVFIGLPSDEETIYGLLYEDLEYFDDRLPCVTRPDKLPKNTDTIDFVTFSPLFQDKVNIGWFIKLPDLEYRSGNNFIFVKRRNCLIKEGESPQLKVNLKNLIILNIPDVSTLMLSTKIKDFRT